MAVSTDTTAPTIHELADEDLPASPVHDDEKPTAATKTDGASRWRRRWRPSSLTVGAITVSTAIVVVAALAGWFGWQAMQAHDKQQRRDVVLQVGRQAAINLTSIDYTTVDADIQRVLDGSVGTFHDEFQRNAKAFADVVRQAQTKTQGSVTEAGVESIDGDTAQLLVTASVKTSSAGAAEQDPRIWRMRITVTQTPSGAEVSNVGFVP